MNIITRAMKLTGMLNQLSTEPSIELLATFEDANEVSSWAKQSVLWCLELGIVNGKNATTLASQDEITKAEAAVMIHRLLQRSGLI